MYLVLRNAAAQALHVLTLHLLVFDICMSRSQPEVLSPTALTTNQPEIRSCFWHPHYLEVGLEQSAGEVAALPAQAGGLRVFVQVAGLTEPLAALQAGIGFFTGVNTNVLLAIC